MPTTFFNSAQSGDMFPHPGFRHAFKALSARHLDFTGAWLLADCRARSVMIKVLCRVGFFTNMSSTLRSSLLGSG